MKTILIVIVGAAVIAVGVALDVVQPGPLLMLLCVCLGVGLGAALLLGAVFGFGGPPRQNSRLGGCSE